MRTLSVALFIFLAGLAQAQPARHAHIMTNEGGLIDWLIAHGHGSQSMLQVLQYLQPYSCGFIHQSFLNELAATPASSPVKTVPLSTYASTTNTVAVVNDGSLLVTTAYGYGRDFVARAGWSRTWGCVGGEDRVPAIYQNASTPAYWYDPGNGIAAFEVSWAPDHFEVLGVTLSNEAGLIDRLVAAGYGNRPVYDALLHLQPLSGGAISQSFMTSLAAVPHTRDVYTAELHNFTHESNNPIVIGEDGDFMIAGIYGRDYRDRTGWQTGSATSPAAGRFLFTIATAPQHYIDSGANTIVEPGRSGWFRYKTTAILFSEAPPPPSAVPLPPSALLVATGLAGAALWRIRRWRARE